MDQGEHPAPVQGGAEGGHQHRIPPAMYRHRPPPGYLLPVVRWET